MDIIETCVLLDPLEKNAPPFDLAAFRQLIVLHGLVRYQNYPEADAKASGYEDSEHVSLDL
jgi:hypothetical protein